MKLRKGKKTTPLEINQVASLYAKVKLTSRKRRKFCLWLGGFLLAERRAPDAFLVGCKRTQGVPLRYIRQKHPNVPPPLTFHFRGGLKQRRHRQN